MNIIVTDGTTGSIQDTFCVYEVYKTHCMLTPPAESGDYSVGPMTLTFTSGTTSQMVTVTAEPDNILENEETFSLSMTADSADNVEVANMAEIIITDATSEL